MYFEYLKMLITVFVNNLISPNEGFKYVTTLFVQKQKLQNNYIESNTEEDIDKKNWIRFKKLPHPNSITETVSKFYVDNEFDDPSVMRNNANIDYRDENLDHDRFVKVNAYAAEGSPSTSKLIVDQNRDEKTLVRKKTK